MVRVRLLPYMRSPIHSPSSLTMIWRCFTSSGDVRAIVSLAGSTIRSRWLARCRQAELDVPLNVQTLREIAIDQVEAHLVQVVIHCDVVQRRSFHPIPQRLDHTVILERDQVQGRVTRRRLLLRLHLSGSGSLVHPEPGSGLVAIGIAWTILANLRTGLRRHEVLIDYHPGRAGIDHRRLIRVSLPATLRRVASVAGTVTCAIPIAAVVNRIQHDIVTPMYRMCGSRAAAGREAIYERTCSRRRRVGRVTRARIHHVSKSAERP